MSVLEPCMVRTESFIVMQMADLGYAAYRDGQEIPRTAMKHYKCGTLATVHYKLRGQGATR